MYSSRHVLLTSSNAVVGSWLPLRASDSVSTGGSNACTVRSVTATVCAVHGCPQASLPRSAVPANSKRHAQHGSQLGASSFTACMHGRQLLTSERVARARRCSAGHINGCWGSCCDGFGDHSHRSWRSIRPRGSGSLLQRQHGAGSGRSSTTRGGGWRGHACHRQCSGERTQLQEHNRRAQQRV